MDWTVVLSQPRPISGQKVVTQLEVWTSRVGAGRLFPAHKAKLPWWERDPQNPLKVLDLRYQPVMIAVQLQGGLE